MFGCKHNRCRIRRKMGGVLMPDGPENQSSFVPSPRDVKAAAETFHLSTGETLVEASESKMLVLVFLRHFGCTFTRQILRGLEELHREARAHGADLVLVHMLAHGSENGYLTGHQDVARIADPERKLYRSFGLKRGRLLELAGPHVWLMAAKSVFKGCGIGPLAGDGRQMPGAFVFHRGEIIAARRARSASELPDLQSLFQSIPSSLPATAGRP